MSDREPAAGDDASAAGAGASERRPTAEAGAATPSASRSSTGGSSPKYCPHCGEEFEPGLNFCPRDGNILQLRHGQHELVGALLGQHYRILEPLGEGGMGQVYLAEHVRIGRRCAVKVMRPALVSDPGAVGRFAREAKTAGRISHRNAAAVYDFGETAEGLIYIVMEHVDGPPLTKILAREGALPPLRAADIALQVADALTAAHRLGIIHRDLKPDNILVARDEGGRDLVKVVDFGIAKALNDAETSYTRTGFVLGTLQYMSPEQLIGEPLDPRSDLYSLGCVFFEMLTGGRTFAGPSGPAAVAQRLTAPPPSPRDLKADIPPELDAIVVRTLARMPAERFQSAEELRSALKQVLGLGPTGEWSAGPVSAAGAAVTAPRSAAYGGTPIAASGPFASPAQATSGGPASGMTPASAPTGGTPGASGAYSSSGAGPAFAASPAETGAGSAAPRAKARSRRLLAAALMVLAAGGAAFAAVLHSRSVPNPTAAQLDKILASGAATSPGAAQPAAGTTTSGVRAARPSSGEPRPEHAADGKRPAASAATALMRIDGSLPAGATILVDGAAVSGRHAVVKPGQHTLAVAAPGYEPFRWSGALAEGERHVWTVELKPTSYAAAVPSSGPAPYAPASPAPASPAGAAYPPASSNAAAGGEPAAGAHPDLERRGRQVAGDFVAAIDARDPAALQRAWPGAAPANLQRWQTFLTSSRNSDVAAQLVSFGPMQVNASYASAPFALQLTYTSTVTGHRTATHRFVAAFRRQGNGPWTLAAVRGTR